MLFYAVPLLNTIVMPLGMAALASRLWDCETKGESCKLLLTLQSRENLFAGKAAMGLLESLLVCLVEAAGVLALAALKQATEPLDTGRFAWLVACTFVINAMLYFFSLWLSMRFRNQTGRAGCWLCGALIGLFANFMPVWFSYFVPFGYYVPLCCVRMLYNEATRTSTFTPEPLRWWLLGVGGAAGRSGGAGLPPHDPHKGGITMLLRCIRAENRKLRGSAIWLVFFVVPLISCLYGTVNFLGNRGC